MQYTIFHIDVNSAYLSWEATYRLQQQVSCVDLRTIPSIIGGDESKRHGIVLAKSIPAKKYGIKTGESLFSARQKCPSLVIVPPNYKLFMKCSDAMVSIFKEYFPLVERYSVDECFLDYTNMSHHFGSPIQFAHYLKNKIQKELGFTVNIGISSNKLLAKMASDFEKPNKIHTLFPDEIQEKMWSLPVRDLFMVGRATNNKLMKLGIYTIGQLANSDPDLLYAHFKSHGYLIHAYANGTATAIVKPCSPEAKGIGNSTTISFDVTDSRTAKLILLSLTETVCMRLRDSNMIAKMVSISIKSHDFVSLSHQMNLTESTDITSNIYKAACTLFDEAWNKEPIRHLGVRVSSLTSKSYTQLSLFDFDNYEKHTALDESIDKIRLRYGNTSIIRASFLYSGLRPLNGGMPEENYPLMSSLL
ncbi:DNA polymerase IV [Vallitalea longa]|uniref:DNA polymerase IV n=1 Tax=Vallitalea longa TaxID=2936439 RepID=A0A9W5YCT9_9FIRM|nr:DNA polymerase IV [Vallitalea longa]